MTKLFSPILTTGAQRKGELEPITDKLKTDKILKSLVLMRIHV